MSTMTEMYFKGIFAPLSAKDCYVFMQHLTQIHLRVPILCKHF